MIITDPPYNVNYQGGTRDKLKIQNDNMGDDNFYDFLFDAFKNMHTALKEGGAFYVWYASRTGSIFEKALRDNDLEPRQQLIWSKNSLVIGRQDYQWRHEPCLYGWKEGASHCWYSDRKQTTVLEFDRPTVNKEHPTMKPVALFAYEIGNSSKKGEKVLDLFGGSGTSIVACEQLGRICLTMEKDPHYCDVIINRWEKLTGKTAEKIA